MTNVEIRMTKECRMSMPPQMGEARSKRLTRGVGKSEPGGVSPGILR